MATKKKVSVATCLKKLVSDPVVGDNKTTAMRKLLNHDLPKAPLSRQSCKMALVIYVTDQDCALRKISGSPSGSQAF